MDLWIETSISSPVVRNDPPPKATLKARIRVTNRDSDNVRVQSKDFRFSLLGSDNAELQVLEPPADAREDAVEVDAGDAGELEFPLMVTADVRPDETYYLAWQWKDESGKVGFDFL